MSNIVSGLKEPTWDFCAAIAKPLGKTPVEVFRLAGLLPASIGTVDDLDGEESQLIEIWRALPPGPPRDTLLKLARGWVDQIKKDQGEE